MKFRTLTGTRYEARCADGCGAIIPADPNVKVVVDFDSRPRKTWIPAHSPDTSTWPPRGPRSESLPREPFPSGCERGSGSLGPDAGAWKGNAGNGRAEPAQDPTNGGSGGFAPASSLAPAQPKAPEPPAQPYGPAPAPLALLASTGNTDATPNPAAGVPWATASLTFNAGSFESARAGLADYAQPGETCAQLRERVNRLVLEDLERSVRAMRELHERLGDTAIRTLSPARAAGAPPAGASSPPFPPRVTTTSALPTHPVAPRALGGSSLGTRAQVLGGPPQDRGPSAPTVEGASPGCQTHPEGGFGPRGIRLPSEGASASLPRLRPSAVDVGRGPDTTPARGAPTVADLVARVQFELTDQGVKRSLAKKSAVAKLCELRGLQSLRECGPADERALRALLENFEQIDSWDLHDRHGQAPRLDARLVLPA